MSVDVTCHCMVKDKIVPEPKYYLLQAHVGSEDKYAYVFNFNKCLILEGDSRDSKMLYQRMKYGKTVLLSYQV